MKVSMAWKLLAIGLIYSSLSIAANPIQPGEAYVTRFSGIAKDTSLGHAIIDVNGTVGSIIDVRYPKMPPKGQHWLNEPQRVPIKAIDAGQVFGIAIDDSNPAIIYITATSKFGLHRNLKSTDWMAGMWGKNGGPGTVYRLQAKNNYQPEIFTTITLNGRKNTGAALGNIVYDAKHKQLFVSDLETGMIHRLSVASGKDLGYFDHGVDGRSVFVDRQTGKILALDVVAFDPTSKAQVTTCPAKFDTSPQCWNLADPRRRVWGLGIFTSPNGTTRLYYSAFDKKSDNQASLWSIGLDKEGNFNIKDVQREFTLPLNKANNQLSVSDIAFSDKGEMLVAENGQLRNLGLERSEPFSKPYDSRLFLYTQNEQGVWTLKGRYDVGNLTKQQDQSQAPAFNNAAGGVDFGYGYTSQYNIDLNKPDEFVWVSGDALCSAEGPCFSLKTNSYSDEDEVHGIQGMPKSSYITPGQPPENLMLESYMIDTDINILPDGSKSQLAAQSDDATMIGDVEIIKRKIVAPPIPLHDTQISAFHHKYDSNLHNRLYSTPFHTRIWSHSRWGSHGKRFSHYRIGSHDLLFSHYRYGSHYRLDSHYRLWSHDRIYSHRKYSSHTRAASHSKYASHGRKASHRKFGSHNRKASHRKYGSHNRKASHRKYGSHNRDASHAKYGSHGRKASHRKYGSHSRKSSHLKYGSHNRDASHAKVGSHGRKASHRKYGSHSRKSSHLKYGSHNRDASHAKIGSHGRKASHHKYGSHSRKSSHLKYGSHNRDRSHAKIGSHGRKSSHRKYGSHSRSASHRKEGSHNRSASHRKYGSHSRSASHRKYGSHSRSASHRKVGSHSRSASHRKYGSHNRSASHRKVGSHSRSASHRKMGSHSRSASHRKMGSHSRSASHRKMGSHSRSASHRKIGSHSRSASHRKVGSHSRSASHRKTGSHSRSASHRKSGSHQTFPIYD